MAVFQLPQRFNAVDDIRPCDLLARLAWRHLFAIHQEIEFLQVGFKLRAEQVERHELLHYRRTLLIQVVEGTVQEQSHAVERRNALRIDHVENRVDDLRQWPHALLDTGHSHIHDAFYFHLYPVRQYTIGNVSGAVEGMTLTATDENGYKSATAITTGNMFFFDADATLTEDRLSLSDASYNVTYNISGSVVYITLTKADKEAIIKANNGDATSLITNADCGDTAGWTNANPKTNQDGPYGLKISCFEQSSTNTVTQTLTDMPAGTYTMTVAVRGGKTIKGQEYTNTITVALNDSQTVVDLVDGNNENKGGTPWTAEYSEEKESGAYLGWKLATVKTTLSTKGNLTIALTPLSNVWTQIYDIHLEWESGATGIHELRMIDNNRQVYTLDGRNVTGFSLRKGIYIINGKKVIY